MGYASDGFVRILPGKLGDCNGDDTVDAGDLSALVLEFFDGFEVSRWFQHDALAPCRDIATGKDHVPRCEDRLER